MRGWKRNWEKGSEKKEEHTFTSLSTTLKVSLILIADIRSPDFKMILHIVVWFQNPHTLGCQCETWPLSPEIFATSSRALHFTGRAFSVKTTRKFYLCFAAEQRWWQHPLRRFWWGSDQKGVKTQTRRRGWGKQGHCFWTRATVLPASVCLLFFFSPPLL